MPRLSAAALPKPASIALILGLLLSLGVQSLAAQPAKPATAGPSGERAWYADRLEKLGFQLYASPVVLPDFQVEALVGAPLKRSSLKGKIVLLNFWATWCPPCRAEMPSIEALHKKMQGKDFAIVGVSVGEQRGTVEKFIASQKFTFPIYLDSSGSLGAAFNARSIPTTYILDKEGRAIAGMVGSRMYDGPEVVGLFEELAKR
jgi:thiol-disulfide isomerase/thioredoxin